MTREEAIKVVKSATVYTPKEIEALETLIPELRESEDEQIRKEIISFIEYEEDRGNIPDGWHQAKRPGVWITYLEKQKEQKPNYCHHEVDEIGWTEEYRKAYYDGWNNCNMQHSQLKAEQKPAEWSEEDEGELQNAIDALEFLGKKGVYKSASGYDAALQAASWLKSLRPQPKQEWSEEDNEHIDGICNALTDNISNIGFYTTEALCSWLKSLPHRFSLSSWGEEIRDGFFGKFNYNPWKPNEKQMDALLNAEIVVKSNNYPEHAKVLAELYNQLKKL